MHNWLFDTIHILHSNVTCIGQIGLLLDRKGVDVCAKQESLSGPVLEHGGNTVATDVRMDLVDFQCFQVLDYCGCCCLLLTRKLGIGVEPFVYLLISILIVIESK